MINLIWVSFCIVLLNIFTYSNTTKHKSITIVCLEKLWHLQFQIIILSMVLFIKIVTLILLILNCFCFKVLTFDSQQTFWWFSSSIDATFVKALIWYRDICNVHLSSVARFYLDTIFIEFWDAARGIFSLSASQNSRMSFNHRMNRTLQNHRISLMFWRRVPNDLKLNSFSPVCLTVYIYFDFVSGNFWFSACFMICFYFGYFTAYMMTNSLLKSLMYCLINVPVIVMLTASLLSPFLFSHQYCPLCLEKAGLVMQDGADVSQSE